MDRRAFIRDGLAFVAAPAIVRVSSLMPLRGMPLDATDAYARLVFPNFILSLYEMLEPRYCVVAPWRLVAPAKVFFGPNVDVVEQQHIPLSVP